VSDPVRSEVDPLDLLADEFLDRLRRGERPTVADYAAQYPELAERIRATFPAIELMEQGAPPTGAAGAGSAVAAKQDLPEVLGDFRLLREIGHGGMGVVYEAVQESLGRPVAVKVLPPALVKRGRFLERFRREARAAGRLHHTNIVPIHGVGEHDGVHFIIMQLIRGQGLDAVMQEVRRLRAGPLTAPDSPAATVAGSLAAGRFEERAEFPGAALAAETTTTKPTPLPAPADAAYFRAVARLGVQAAGALAYAHAQGVVHRDVKLSNLLLDLQGTLWVTDFGLAKADDSDALTDTGDLLGTLRYMAPERFDGVADARSDVYALGVTLYELLALRPAFDEADRGRLILHPGDLERQHPLQSHRDELPHAGRRLDRGGGHRPGRRVSVRGRVQRRRGQRQRHRAELGRAHPGQPE
jgi:serine/threonine protein kinase